MASSHEKSPAPVDQILDYLCLINKSRFMCADISENFKQFHIQYQ